MKYIIILILTNSLFAGTESIGSVIGGAIGMSIALYIFGVISGTK